MNEPVKHLPNSPGVYLFKDEKGDIIYIGKAKELKKRVASYFLKTDKDWKIKALIDEYKTIDYIPTETETDALLLEAQMIQHHKPKFNVLLKSGQPFVYLLFTKALIPELKIVRTKKEKGTYFGPFLHKKQARAVAEYIQKTFTLSHCNKKIPSGCLLYHLNLCAGTCTDTFDSDAYNFRVQLAIELLRGKYATSLKMINDQIALYTKALEFEKAQHLHEYAQNLETIFNTLKSRFTDTKYLEEQLRAVADSQASYEAYHQTARDMQRMFRLPTPPYKIDCFDISHFQSSSIVGSCVRFTNGKPDRNAFRRFKIKTLTQQNDYAALQEIVGRRYKDDSDLPDLIVIDGGKGQLSAIAPYTTIPCISLAKQEEEIFVPGNSAGIPLDVKTAVGKLLIELRDYTHHFAISYHRKRRHKDFKEQL